MANKPPTDPRWSILTREDYLRDYITSPKEIKEGLDEYIIGQDHVKKILSVASLQRSVRVLASKQILHLETQMQKNNILMLGGTGTGKTALIKALAQVLDVPILIYDITGTTSSGYVGMKVENIIGQYVADTISTIKQNYIDSGLTLDYTDIVNRGLEYAECGIVYIDEFDKCRRVKEHTGRDINGEGVQQGLLKLLEGEVMFLGDDKLSQKFGISEFNTANLLIICGGAFQGLADIILKRLSVKSGIGFTSDISLKEPERQQELFKELINQDLIEYGFLPEVIGRITYHVSLDKMTEEMLIRILTQSKNSVLKQYQSLFRLWGLDLKFTKDALKYIAQKAIKTKTGARALNTLVSKILLDLQYEIDEYKEGNILITRKYCQKKLEGTENA